MDIACALAVCVFNDGALSLHAIAQRLGWSLTANSKHALKARDTMRIKRSKYKAGEKGKSL